MSLDKKQIKRVKKTDLSITVLLIVGILIVVNFFSYQIFFRWDLTENNIFSISDASKNTLSNLDDIVSVKAYFSSTLPSQVLSLKQEVADILNDYEAYSNGKLRVEFIDPKDDPQAQQELATIGIPQLTFEVYEKDNLQLVNGYMGLAISYGSKVEPIPAIKQNTSDLEYQITTAIKKVTTEEIATIGYLTSQGTPDRDAELKLAVQQMQELYTITSVDLSDENVEVPTSVNTLIIYGPTETFSDSALRAINSFLVRGGALYAAVDGVSIGQGLFANKNATGLEGLLSSYGITLNQDLAADTRSGMASFSQGFLTFSSNYAFWPKVQGDGFNSEQSAVSNLESAIFPWASSINIDTGKISEDDFTYLANTTANGWVVKDNFDVSPNNAGNPQGTRGKYNLAAIVNGILTNPYSESEENSQFNGRIVVVGDSDFARDNFLRNSPDNLTLFLNLVDLLSFDEDLINIRSKGVTSRPIKDGMSESSKAGIRYFNVFGLTVAVIAFGLVRYYMRRKSRFVDDL
jgi:gliding-associated putative ABC transporter substrate-binding component GldG